MSSSFLNTPRTITILAVLLLAPLPNVLYAADTSLQSEEDLEIEEPINPEWLRLDIDVAGELKPLLYSLGKKTPRASAFVKDLNSQEIPEARDMGFGNKKYLLTRAGGYVSCRITVLSHDDRLAAVRSDCTTGSDWPRIKQTILEGWGKSVKPIEDGLRYEYSNGVVQVKMQQSVTDALGPLNPYATDEVEGPYREHYSTLADPFAGYDVGERCYYAGIEPEGRASIDSLVAGDQINLIRSVLRSINPEARVYAIEALRTLEKKGYKITEVDKLAIEKVRSLGIPISACYGCEVVRRPAEAILSEIEGREKPAL